MGGWVKEKARSDFRRPLSALLSSLRLLSLSSGPSVGRPRVHVARRTMLSKLAVEASSAGEDPSEAVARELRLRRLRGGRGCGDGILMAPIRRTRGKIAVLPTIDGERERREKESC